MDQNEELIIDTEGNDPLREVAALDSCGNIIYEAISQETLSSPRCDPKVKPLKRILTELAEIIRGKTLICHYAVHDREVLELNFKKAGIPWPEPEFICTWQLAKKRLPNLKSHALDHLGDLLDLKVRGKRFSRRMAHSARYDALFTYELLKELDRDNKTQENPMTASKTVNPFSSSRVDHPFQKHPDEFSVYEKEFSSLTAAIDGIKSDPNHQSRGVVITGPPGSGKTHLMMRLARKKLRSNRLFFIRQPNHPDQILYHIYSRMLESLVEMVPGTDYSQLEYLLGISFSNIITSVLGEKATQTKRELKIMEVLSLDHLNIYKMLGSEGTENKRRVWQFIEKKTLGWWHDRFSSGGSAASIIQGLTKYCAYTDPSKREIVRQWLAARELEEEKISSVGLSNWKENLSKEVFSLEAIQTFGKLSLSDEPLILIFDQLEGLKYDEEILTGFGNAVKEIITCTPNCLVILNMFPDRWKHFSDFFDSSFTGRFSDVKNLEFPNRDRIKDILRRKAEASGTGIGDLFTAAEFQRIISQSSIRDALNCAAELYDHKIHAAPLTPAPQTFEEVLLDKLEQMQQDLVLVKQRLKIHEDEKKEKSESPRQADIKYTLLSYLNEQKERLTRDYFKKQIIGSADDLGKLRTILSMSPVRDSIRFDRMRMGKRSLPEHIQILTKNESFVVGFLHEGGLSYTHRIKNINELVIHEKESFFKLFRDRREPPVKGKVGKSETEKFDNASNGNFVFMDKENRITFELIHKLITDIREKDISISFDDAFRILSSEFPDYWLIKMIQRSQAAEME